MSALLSIHRCLQNNLRILIAFFDSRKPQPFAALIATLVGRERLTATYSRFGQSMTALRKTPEPQRV